MLFDYDQKFLWNNFINHEDDNYFGEEVDLIARQWNNRTMREGEGSVGQ